MNDDIAIRVEHVSKNFVLPHERVNSIKGLFTSLARGRKRGTETQHALKDISFEIKRGEFFGIVGRNGSGKSTLLKILAGIYQPTAGSVQTSGKLVPFIELGVGFNVELTGRENVYLNGAMLGFSKKEIDAMFHDIVAFAELERFMDQKLKNYSSGMQVRLAFSMAVRAEADILLIDEVLAVGDADFQRKCFDYFNQLKHKNTTVVFVSHDMSAVHEYCDRAILIEESRIVTSGKTDDVTKAYTKLFMAKELSHGQGTGDNRWGDQSITTTRIDAKISEQHIEIQHTIKAHKAVDGPVVGIRVRDSAGREVTGTNTKIEQQHVAPMRAGQTLTLRWQFANVLSDGRYTIDPAILHADAITVADWWDDALALKIQKSRHLPYIVDPSFQVDID